MSSSADGVTDSGRQTGGQGGPKMDRQNDHAPNQQYPNRLLEVLIYAMIELSLSFKATAVTILFIQL